jgi:mono/diheme cytochrome c family protein
MVKKILRWLGIILGVLVVLILLAAVVVYFRSEALVNKTYDAPANNLTIPTDAAAVERGRYLAHSVSVCVDCHGENLAGGIVADDPALGRIVAPNLTTGQGGVGADYRDADFVRVLRYGVMPDGASAKIMPSDDYQHLTDADLAAIIAYVRSVPPQDSILPTTELRILGRILLATGQLPIMIADRVNPNMEREPVSPGITAEYGSYLADIAGCTGCHGPELSGGPIPAAPPDWPHAMNLTPSGEVGQWSEADFMQTIRSGVNPAGKGLNPEFMPWPRYASMTDEDLKALWAYISTVPAKPVGTR